MLLQCSVLYNGETRSTRTTHLWKNLNLFLYSICSSQRVQRVKKEHIFDLYGGKYDIPIYLLNPSKLNIESEIRY